MNHTTDIFGVQDRTLSRSVQEAHTAFVSYVRDLRKGLGGQKGVLDRYLLTFFHLQNVNNAYHTQDYALDTAMVTLRHLLVEYRDNPQMVSNHPFFSTMVDYIREHPCPDSRYSVEYYFFHLCADFTECALRMFEEDWRESTGPEGVQRP